MVVEIFDGILNIISTRLFWDIENNNNKKKIVIKWPTGITHMDQ